MLKKDLPMQTKPLRLRYKKFQQNFQWKWNFAFSRANFDFSFAFYIAKNKLEWLQIEFRHLSGFTFECHFGEAQEAEKNFFI